MPPSPLDFRRVRSSRAGGCIRAWVIAMRCSALPSWRFPLRDKRCRCLFDAHKGNGAVPVSLAKVSLEWKRATWAVPTTILADGPHPTMTSSRGTTRVTRSVISVVSSLISALVRADTNQPPRQTEHQARLIAAAQVCRDGVECADPVHVGWGDPAGIEFVQVPAQVGR